MFREIGGLLLVDLYCAQTIIKMYIWVGISYISRSYYIFCACFNFYVFTICESVFFIIKV